MKLLLLCPGKTPETLDEVRCFTDVLNYYLPLAMRHTNSDTTVIKIPAETCVAEIADTFKSLDVSGYDAIVTLGLRFYSKIPVEITNDLRSRFSGLFCQIHDGSRLDGDPVDITFTFKNDDLRFESNPGWYRRHVGRNIYMGWAADPTINVPQQHNTDLRILIDHTNYGGNKIDLTSEVLSEVKKLIDSKIWADKWQSISVRRFDSGRVVDVDINDVGEIIEYDRTSIPLTEISREHGEAHVFMVTHPESVGLVVLETSMAGALTVAPQGFIPKDRLSTVRHVEWEGGVDWPTVLSMIDPQSSRSVAMCNTWEQMSRNILNELHKRLSR